jgi:hypothetical protein
MMARANKTRERSQPFELRLLPMQLQIGDRLTDETGDWEIIARPYTTAGGKNARVRVQRVSEPAATELRTWGAHERISVKRAATEEGKR